MFEAMLEHMKYTFNDGTIKPAVTIFRQRKPGMCDLRVWNPLFLMHAGYQFQASLNEENDVGEEVPVVKKVGDQMNVEFTRVCMIAKEFFI